ncbi:hypothetical protein BGZ58_006493, partial [Dissophora ornata]
MNREQRPMQTSMPQRQHYDGPNPGQGSRYPGQGYGNQHPLRAIPSHLQRPPFEQPMPNHPKSPNPLDDLVDTEKEYVADLKVLLQRVSAGWTQDDFPPKEVDILLRNIEDIYAVNRKFSKKLVDVQASDDVMKELGSVLMWFVDSMETSYSNFCRNHVPHFDNWPEIMNNSRLQDILGEIAGEQFQHVTLDTFLMKPIDRLHYYRRLYMRLLDSSERGKPDFDALEAAFMRIDTILRFVTVDVPGTSRHPASPALSGISSMSSMRYALPSPPITDQTSPNFHPQSRPNNNISPGLPPSPLSPRNGPNQGPDQPDVHSSGIMQEIERSLDTAEVLDLFTMQPKACSLSLALIERDVLIRSDVTFTITTDEGIEERFDDGHIILLSDLLLMCRVKTADETDMNPEGNESSFWLLFPPLAIRHVVAKDGTVDDNDHIVELTIVNRVTARIYVADEDSKFNWMDEVTDAQQRDSAKASQQQGQQQQGQHMNRNSMRRTNTVTAKPGAPRGQVPGLGEVAAAKEVMFKTMPCDVFQWRDDIWDPLIEDDDCYADLRLTSANRLAMAVTTAETGQLILNAWIVESTTFRRASETD